MSATLQSRPSLYSTAVGKKYVMAVSGMVLMVYVVAHMIGNLKLFFGAESLNAYSHWLREVGEPALPREWLLWGVRIVLLGALFAHLWAAYTLTMINRRARPTAYRSKRDYVAADFASRTMRWTGIIVLLFVIFHLFDLTWGPANPDFVSGDPYRNIVASFERHTGRDHLRGREPCFGRAPLPRRMEPVPEHGLGAAVAAPVRDRGHGDRRARQRLLPALRRLRGGQLSDLMLESLIPPGSIQRAWDNHRFTVRLVNASNKRRFKVIVVGTGLAGGSAAATLAELGYEVEVFTFHDSPRRAHSIAAQGGINAAKDYRNDGDSIFRLFYDTIKGGDFRSREANVYRLAQVSNEIIDQATAQGVPFAREYGGLLDNRSFGGAQVSRTFYARGQTGQQLLLGAYQAMMRQVATGKVTLHTRTEMLDVVVHEGKARGVVVRDLLSGEVRSHSAHAVVLATGGYSNAFFLSTNAKASNATAIWRAHKRGAAFANPCFTQIHPTCIPQSDDTQSKLTLMSESLRNDGRIWVPLKVGDDRHPGTIPEDERDYFLERRYPAFGNLVPRDVASRAAKGMIDEDRGVGPRRNGVYLDFADAISRLGMDVIRARYGNLFQMYERITGEDPYEVPMRIYPAPHYTMGGLWVDYDLMTTVPGLYAIGEANFSDHGANRLGAIGADAGARGRLLHPPGDDRRLPGAAARVRAAAHRSRRVPARRGGGPRARRALSALGGRALGRLVPPRARQGPVGRVRDGAQRPRPAARDERDRCSARAFQGRREGAGLRRDAEPVAGEGRAASTTSSRSLSSCAATRCIARSPAAGISARSTRRPTVRRCATTTTSPTWPPGSTPAASRSCTRRTSPSSTCGRRSGATHEADTADLAPGRARTRGRFRDL